MLGKRIAELRKKHGWSQEALAKQLHISPSAVGMYEQGRREPSIDVLGRMSDQFGVTIDYLITGEACTLTDPKPGEQTDLVMDTISVLHDLSCEELVILLVAKLLSR